MKKWNQNDTTVPGTSPIEAKQISEIVTNPANIFRSRLRCSREAWVHFVHRTRWKWPFHKPMSLMAFMCCAFRTFRKRPYPVKFSHHTCCLWRVSRTRMFEKHILHGVYFQKCKIFLSSRLRRSRVTCVLFSRSAPKRCFTEEFSYIVGVGNRLKWMWWKLPSIDFRGR